MTKMQELNEQAARAERLASSMAEAGGAETIDFSKTDVYDELMRLTNKRGPDSCIDAVGCEASGHGAADAVLDKVKAAAFLATDRVHDRAGAPGTGCRGRTLRRLR